ncbi:M23 family metallopeptidase [Microbacterium sp. C5A9]|uniref:M23 family metallopeptidase n=1 Tax=Microbacterium sp. C5A9 TaxID=2736663 RepID=UPI001F52B0B7|nr:M23 family metallopeptidase [Microbacterium sp. C5A9]MCI1019199.1 M23 family metallopeptidase [Microbacterium sp. C5A9]
MCDAGDAEPSSDHHANPFFSRRALLIGAGAALGAAAIGWDLVSPDLTATAAGTYLRPCGDSQISSSWQGHRNRTPPSGEPGTDYAVPTGTPVRAAADGVIVDRKDSTTTATGRYLALRADDGNYIRYLHLQSSAVLPGTRVTRGQVIAVSGASGFGSEAGYGAHVHVSLWIGGTPLQLGFTNSVDFENYVQPEDPVPIHQSSTYFWNAPVPANVWTKIQVSSSQIYLAQSAGNNRETGDLTIYLKALGVTRGLQVRAVAEVFNYAGGVVSTSPQPVMEIPATSASAANASTFGHYTLPYFLSGSIRLFAEVRALNAGTTIQQVIVKKNYWQS